MSKIEENDQINEGNTRMKIIGWIRQHILIVLIFCAVCILFLSYFSSYIWEWVKKNAESIIQIFFGAFLANLFTLWLYSRLVDEPMWKEEIGRLDKSVNKLSEELKKIGEDYNGLIGRFPDAIGGKFTKSLFEYIPETSRKLAEILSKRTGDWYLRHYNRVLVEYAEDLYRLRRVHEVQDAGAKPGDNIQVWEFDFYSTWKWVNDSQTITHPLNNFMIIISAPDDAIEKFTVGTKERRAQQMKDFFEFIKSKNIVRSIIFTKKPLNEKKISEIFEIQQIEVDFGIGDPTKILAKDLLKVPKEELLPGVYLIYKLPVNIANKSLEKGGKVTISYKGKISLPMFETDGKFYGEFKFPPSDIIADKYTMSIIYPENIDIDNISRKIEINEEDSGCWFVNERIDSKFEYSGALPTGFELDNNEKFISLVVDGPLTDLNFISIVWKAS